ncbi:MAG: nucleoside hydrolase [Peptoniphilaceae bacterium]|nr:nucleoside hydrolase [Peptoniphilaceae bacterium]
MKRRIPVILDGDPGHDDAIAWVLANACAMMDIQAITTVCGNQTIEKVTDNARRVATLLGIRAPIAQGDDRPLLQRRPLTAASVHGKSGLDGPQLPEPAMELAPEGAIELMAKILRETEEKVWIIATGPQTNVAKLLLTHPELKAQIAGISLMGGGIYKGNWTAAAEFNILADPESASIVFQSGLPILMSGLDVTEKALIYEEDFERIRRLGNPVAKIVAEWLGFFYQFHRQKGYAGAPLHDAVAVCALAYPELLQTEPLYVQIECAGDYCRGATIADRRAMCTEKPNASVAMKINQEGFVEKLIEAAQSYGEGECHG